MIPADEVHVWTASLALPFEHGYLSPDEVARRDRFVFPVHRERFARGRGLLRAALGTYLGVPPGSLRFMYGDREKPALVGEPLQFNLSHSEDCWMLAVSAARPLGVDVEATRALDDFERMAERFFAPGERTALRGSPDKLAAFYRGWTRKEALMKATGQGMALALDAFEVDLDRPRLLWHAHDPGAPARWTLADVPAPEGFAAALAVEGSGWRLIGPRDVGTLLTAL